MSLIAFSEFVDRVKQNVFPDLEPENLQFPHARFIQNGLITAQTYVECLRNNNVNFYDHDDWSVSCNVASFTGPEKSRIQAVYAFKPCQQCVRQHYDQKSTGAIMCYVDQRSHCHCRTEDDICQQIMSGSDFCDQGLGDSENIFLCSDKFFAKGSSDKLYLAPLPPCDFVIAVHWEGIKYRYEDDDLIADDEDLIDLISTYLRGDRALYFDRDLALHKEIMRKPEKFGDWGGQFWQKLSAMAHRCREERRIRKTHACEAIFDDTALPNFEPVPAVDQSECYFYEELDCEEGQYALNGECVDCVAPTLSLTADQSTIIVGQSVVLSWENTVPPLDSSIVTLENNGEVIATLTNNSSGTVTVTPTESTSYLIRALTLCGNIVSTVGITVEDEPCLCPSGLPDCLDFNAVDPADFTQCNGDAYDSADEEDVWDGEIPRVSDCVWEVPFSTEPNGAGGESVAFFGKVVPFRVRVELISCNPYVYEMTMSSKFEGDELIFWKGRCENLPVGTYVSQGYGIGQIDNYCYAAVDFDFTGCFDTPCTQPEIRFDPPEGSTVSFPTLVFLHSTNDTDYIYYSIDGGSYTLYTGPFSMSEGQELSAYSVTIEGCIGEIDTADYVSDNSQGLNFEFICDGPNDKAGVFDVFGPNGVTNDYHWRITVTRELPWAFNSARIYETNSSGVWVTGQAWATMNPIFPVEMSPDPFSVYPLVLFNDSDNSQLNNAYLDPLGVDFPDGQRIFHGYGQPFVALTGYFRLELTISEDGGPEFTIYKLIPHTCEACEAPDAPVVSANCEGEITISAEVTPNATYRILRATQPACGTGVFAVVSEGISVTGEIEYTEEVTVCCTYRYIIAEYCVGTQEFVNSPSAEVTVPCEEECSCDGAECSDLQDVYYIANISLIQQAVQNCTTWGDCQMVCFPAPCEFWDQSYSRVGTDCEWDSPRNRTEIDVHQPSTIPPTYDGTYLVHSSLARVIDGEDCYWRVRFWCDATNEGQVEYRKTSGNTPEGTYTKQTDVCTAEFGFPVNITIQGTPDD